jgi:hypothetical protein
MLMYVNIVAEVDYFVNEVAVSVLALETRTWYFVPRWGTKRRKRRTYSVCV